jgi:hypothetical protein
MATRLELNELFCEILGSRNVYYQPPESIKMKYPAIVYSRSKIDNRYANDSIYDQLLAYDITVIDEDPDSEIVEKISKLPFCSFDRHYTADNLNHDTFTIYY